MATKKAPAPVIDNSRAAQIARAAAEIKAASRGSTSVSSPMGSTMGVAKKNVITPQKVVSSSRGGGQTNYSAPASSISTKKTPVNINKALESGGLVQDKIQPTNKSNVVQYKQPGVLDKVGSFFDKIFKSVGAGSQGASALQATVGTGLSPKETTTAYTKLGSNASGENTGMKGYNGRNEQVPTTKNANLDVNKAFNSGGIKKDTGLVDANGMPVVVPQTTQNPVNLNQAFSSSGLIAGTSPAESKTTTVDPLTGAKTTLTQNLSAPAPQTNPTATANITGLTDSLLKDLTPGNAWDKNQRGEFQDTKIVNYQSTAANMFNSPQEVDNSYNGDSVFRANIDKTAKATNKSPQDVLNGIKAKVVPATNGVVPAQGTAQYLDLINTKNTPKALKAEADLMNKEVIMTSQFNSDQDKLAHDILEQTKKDSQAIIDSITRKELSRETTLREKAQYLIDKERATFDMKDAEVEQNRILAKTNLTEFLAHIGALNTDGHAAVGLATLDQKYQAQRQALRSGFELATREIQMNMNSDINELESKMEDDVLKINMDLSKSEREVMLDSLKLRNSTNKAILEAQQKYATALRQEKDKMSQRAESNADRYNSSFLTLAGLGFDGATAKKMLGSNGNIIPTTSNFNAVASAKSTKKSPETEPKYTGEKLKTFTTKTTQKFLDSGLIDEMDIQGVAEQLQQGWSLQQIAKNSNMPTSIYNLFKEQLITEN